MLAMLAKLVTAMKSHQELADEAIQALQEFKQNPCKETKSKAEFSCIMFASKDPMADKSPEEISKIERNGEKPFSGQ